MDQGLLLNFTGEGKGKTSAAFGTALRALGWGWRIAVLQFIKDEATPTGEALFFQRYFPDTVFERFGAGMLETDADHRGAARRGWARARELLKNFPGELLILDELNVALHFYLLEPDEVAAALLGRRSGLNVVITGRYIHKTIRDICDLVSAIDTPVHPFRKGVPARRGIDF